MYQAFRSTLSAVYCRSRQQHIWVISRLSKIYSKQLSSISNYTVPLNSCINMTSPALSDILKHPFYVCSVAKRLTGVAAMVIRIVGLSVWCWSGQQAVVLFQHHDIIVNSGGSPNQGTTLVQQLLSQHLNCYTKRSDPLDEVPRCWAKVATIWFTLGPHTHTLNDQ